MAHSPVETSGGLELCPLTLSPLAPGCIFLYRFLEVCLD